MDYTFYIGIGIAIGSAIGGAAAGIVNIRKQKYLQAKDEFRTLMAEYKEDNDKKEERISKLEQAIEKCKEDHRLEKMKTYRLEQEVDYLKKMVKGQSG